MHSRDDHPPMRASTRRHALAGLVGWMALTAAAAGLGAAASVDAAPFYSALARPAWAPPPGVFGPVWTLLYALMGLAAWIAWRHRAARSTMALYVVQLVANALWSWLFFAWHRGALALLDVVLLWLLVVATLLAFARVRRLAGMLLLPYLAWVSFATALSAAVWRLNPAVLGA